MMMDQRNSMQRQWALQRMRPFGNLACSSGGGCDIGLFVVLARVLRDPALPMVASCDLRNA